MKRFIGVIALIGLVGCTSSANDFAQTMKREGVTEFKSTGYEVFGCSEDDIFHTGFTGVKNGVPVKGVVCSGLLKAETVRYR